jgi:hypothetical protein
VKGAWGSRIVKLTYEVRNVTLQASIQQARLAGFATNRIHRIIAAGRCNGDLALSAQFRRWADVDRVASNVRLMCLGLVVGMGVTTC